MASIKSDNILVFPMLNRNTNYYDSSRNLSGNNLQKWSNASSNIIKTWDGTERFYTNGVRDTNESAAKIFFVNGLYVAIKTTNEITSLDVYNNFDSITDSNLVDGQDGNFKLIEYDNSGEVMGGYTRYLVNDLKFPISIDCAKM